MKNNDNSVIRSGNHISFLALDTTSVVSSFVSCLKQAIYKAGYQDIVIDISRNITYYPNVVVPICGIIEYYRVVEGVDFLINGENRFYNKSILSLYQPDEDNSELNRPLSKVWRFTSTQEVCDIQKRLIDALRREEIFAEGVLEGLEWSINEVMDNVLNHSQSDAGFIMGQLHKTTKHVAFTIFDAGIGIHNSFKGSKFIVRNNIDALSLCIQEGVTHDSKLGQGNGLAGLFSLIKEGNGLLNIASGRDTFSYYSGEVLTHLNQNNPISRIRGCTSVDFQIDYSKEVSIDKVLTFQGRSFTFTNLFIDNLENDLGHLCFKVAEMSEGTGTRESALRLKNVIINSIQGKKLIAEIDFSGIEVVSSSYIDELIAKLLIELGLFQFNRRIVLKNMSDILQKTMQKSVVQRIIEDYT